MKLLKELFPEGRSVEHRPMGIENIDRNSPNKPKVQEKSLIPKVRSIGS